MYECGPGRRFQGRRICQIIAWGSIIIGVWIFIFDEVHLYMSDIEFTSVRARKLVLPIRIPVYSGHSKRTQIKIYVKLNFLLLIALKHTISDNSTLVLNQQCKNMANSHPAESQ
jgi:hypothetical protein